MTYSKGLAGVIAGETAISEVRGDEGQLTYRGYPIEELVQLPYRHVMYLVLFGELPDTAAAASLESYLHAHARLSAADHRLLDALPEGLHPMKALQGALPLLAWKPGYRFEDHDEEVSRGIQLLARMPQLIAGLRARQTGNRLPDWQCNKSYLGNFLAAFTGQPVDAEHERILTVVQILQMEHSFNAGTFAARVVGSTLASVDAVMSAAVGALSGVLHGGADEAALRDAWRAGSPDNAGAFLDELLAGGDKLMGMGHREYRVVDPRSAILKPMAKQLCADGDGANTFATLAALEDEFARRMADRGRPLKANLEFYKGAVYEKLGIPPEYFTSVFAMSRMVGWLAHFIELRKDNRIMRPQAVYTGAAPRHVG